MVKFTVLYKHYRNLFNVRGFDTVFKTLPESAGYHIQPAFFEKQPCRNEIIPDGYNTITAFCEYGCKIASIRGQGLVPGGMAFEYRIFKTGNKIRKFGGGGHDKK
jgi:hypothetical protein